MNKKTNDNALGDIIGGKCEFEEEQFGKCEVDSGIGGKCEVKVMHRNKNYCPECGRKYSSEKDAFCPQCGHPRVVEKTW